MIQRAFKPIDMPKGSTLLSFTSEIHEPHQHGFKISGVLKSKSVLNKCPNNS